MEQINKTSRIHPLMAAAALSVIALSVAGTAAITGLIPSSKADTSAVATAPQALVAPQALAAQPAPTAQQLADAQLMVAKYSPQAAQPLPAPEPEYEKPVVKKVVHTQHHAPQHTRLAQHQSDNYRAQPAYRSEPVQQQASQPNYVGIGTGAVIGGLLGNQIGGGKGKKIATVAGVIGGGFLGNEIANRNK
ncbi:glycine zipper 2TM domain-containing protein [Massilia antarctica]|uniref:Glycine zipper 2TM domain-containing protein n=1 Tax=Massilia antarctica TaxID=2765360 RepID=A0AA48WEI6_9BURK|nr:glycine zipper 2TM domain-containing protein [Massilia antarctica]QPI51011.1 glycine zipper 2TM domain-containing protein [Massilia antarctica]